MPHCRLPKLRAPSGSCPTFAFMCPLGKSVISQAMLSRWALAWSPPALLSWRAHFLIFSGSYPTMDRTDWVLSNAAQIVLNGSQAQQMRMVALVYNLFAAPGLLDLRGGRSLRRRHGWHLSIQAAGKCMVDRYVATESVLSSLTTRRSSRSRSWISSCFCGKGRGDLHDTLPVVHLRGQNYGLQKCNQMTLTTEAPVKNRNRNDHVPILLGYCLLCQGPSASMAQLPTLHA